MNEDDYIFENYESYIERSLQEQVDNEAMREEYCKYIESSDTDELQEWRDNWNNKKYHR